MRKMFCVPVLMLCLLLVLTACTPREKENPPLMLEYVHLVQAGQEKELSLEGEQYVICHDGYLKLSFNRTPTEEELTDIFGSGPDVSMNGKQASLRLDSDMSEFSWPETITGRTLGGTVKTFISSGERTLQLTRTYVNFSGTFVEFPNGPGHYPVQGEGRMYFYFSEPLDKEIARTVAGATVRAHDDVNMISFELKPGVEEIRLNDNLLDTQGNELAESYVYTFAYSPWGRKISFESLTYPWLEHGYDVFLTNGEQVRLRLNWPFPRSEVERVLQKPMAGSPYEIVWENDQQLILTILPSSKVNFWLDLEGLTDAYGAHYMHDQSLHFNLRFRPQQSITVLSMRDGSRAVHPIPFPVTRALEVSGETVTLIRLVGTAPFHGLRQDVALDLSTGSVTPIRTFTLEMNGYDRAYEAWDMVRDQLSTNMYPVAAGISPSGQYIAAIRMSYGLSSEADATIDIFDKHKNHIVTYPIHLISRGTDTIVGLDWSHDEEVIYYEGYEKHRRLIGLNIASGEEVVVFQDVSLIAGLPNGHLMIGKSGDGAYIVSPDGQWHRFGDLRPYPSLGVVLDESRILINIGNECFLYDLTTHTNQLLFAGSAFWYDADNQHVYLLTEEATD